MANERSMKLSRMFKRFLPYFGKYKHLLVLDLMAAALTTVCELVLPLIVRRITNGAMATDPALMLTTGLIIRMGLLYIRTACMIYTLALASLDEIVE